MTIADKIVAEALTWLRTPYHHCAGVKGAGVDCIHFPLRVFQAVGLVDPEFTIPPYPNDWHLNHSEELWLNGLGQFSQLLEPADGPTLAGIGVFRYGRTFSHGSICIDPAEGMVIHSYIGSGVVTSRVSEAPLAGRRVLWFKLKDENER